jgi:hypothetical protein
MDFSWIMKERMTMKWMMAFAICGICFMFFNLAVLATVSILDRSWNDPYWPDRIEPNSMTYNLATHGDYHWVYFLTASLLNIAGILTIVLMIFPVIAYVYDESQHRKKLKNQSSLGEFNAR